MRFDSKTLVPTAFAVIMACLAASTAIADTGNAPATSPDSMEAWHALVADTNGDGVVNILDLAPPGADATRPVRGTGLERLVAELPDGGIPSVPAGESVTFQIRLENSTTPLFGYSLGISMQPLPGSGGESTGVADESSFFIEQNLIAGAGFTIDELFSVILDDGYDGVFVNANTSDGSTVIAVPGINDILAEVTFQTQPGALGPFEVRLNGATALADGNGFAVPYDYDPLVIEVTIAPCSGADLAEPFQILDLNDLLEFGQLFQAQDPRVDFAVPVGLFDLADVLQFVNFFLAGC